MLTTTLRSRATAISCRHSETSMVPPQYRYWPLLVQSSRDEPAVRWLLKPCAYRREVPNSGYGIIVHSSGISIWLVTASSTPMFCTSHNFTRLFCSAQGVHRHIRLRTCRRSRHISCGSPRIWKDPELASKLTSGPAGMKICHPESRRVAALRSPIASPIQ